MKKQLLSLIIMTCLSTSSYSQPISIYQPNGTATRFRAVTYDSLNYYVNLNYSPFSVMKIDANNKAIQICDLAASTPQMIFNQGKGIYKTSVGYSLFNGTTHSEISTNTIPATYPFNTIGYDYFHIGTSTYFQNQKNIFKTDYSSATSIQTLYTSEATSADPISNVISTIYNTGKSIYFTESGNPYSGTSPVLKRIDLVTGIVTTVNNIGSSSFGLPMINYNHCLYFATGATSLNPFGEVKKADDNGMITTLSVGTSADNVILALLGVTPNGVIGYTLKKELMLIASNTSTPLNHNVTSSPLPRISSSSFGKSTNTLVFYEALDSLQTLGPEEKALWVTDGTLTGTKKVISKTDYYSGVASFNTFNGITSSAVCGDDLFFAGQKTATQLNLYQVNGLNNSYTIHTNFNNVQSFYKNPSGGIYMIGSPALAQFAVYKVNCSGVTGIIENLSNQISVDVFPNPCRDQISIASKLNFARYQISSITGQLTQTGQYQNKPINISSLKNGVYILSLFDDNGERKVVKIIKE